RAEVDHRRIDFDLAEVRIECGVECEIGCHAIFEVHAARNLAFRIAAKRVVTGIDSLVLRDDVGQYLESLTGWYARQARQVAVTRNPLGLCLGCEREHGEFTATRDVALELHTP